MIDNLKTRTLISREQLSSRIKELASQINKDFQGQEIVLVGILTKAVYQPPALRPGPSRPSCAVTARVGPCVWTVWKLMYLCVLRPQMPCAAPN